MSKKIAIFVETLGAGGIQKVVLELSDSFLRKGHEVHLFVLRNKIDYEVNNNIDLHVLSDSNISRIAQLRPYLYAKKINILLKEIGAFDLMISNLGSFEGSKIITLLRLDQDKVYHCVHNTQSKRRFKRHKKNTFLKALKTSKIQKSFNNKHLITVSDGVRDDLLNTIKARPKSIMTIYNPFDIDLIRKKASEQESAIPKERYIIHVGRYELGHKRQDVLIKAFKKARTEHKLLLLGDGSDRGRIEELIASLDLQERVLLPGFHQNPYPFIHHADLLVLSSDYEGFGNVLAEALILDTPIVSTDCESGPSEIMGDELSAFLVPTGDVEALSKKIEEALDSYPKIETRHIERFDEKRIVKEYLSLIR